MIVGVATTLGTTAGQAFGARHFQEVSLGLQRCVLPLVLKWPWEDDLKGVLSNFFESGSGSIDVNSIYGTGRYGFSTAE